MNEWTVVTVLIAVIGLITTIVKPVISLNTTITRLDESVAGLKLKIDSLSMDYDQYYLKLSNAINQQNQQMLAHEVRIQNMESGKNTSGIPQ